MLIETLLLILAAVLFYVLGYRVATRRHDRCERIAQELRSGVISGWPPVPGPLPPMPAPPPEPTDAKPLADPLLLPPRFTNEVPAYVVVGEKSLRGEP